MEQVDEYLQHEIAQFLSRLHDENYLITVTGVDTSKDLNNANIFISVIDLKKKEINESDIINELNEIKPELHEHLLDRLDFRKIPELHFKIDHTAENAQKMDKLIDTL